MAPHNGSAGGVTQVIHIHIHASSGVGSGAAEAEAVAAPGARVPAVMVCDEELLDGKVKLQGANVFGNLSPTKPACVAVCYLGAVAIIDI